MTTPTTSPAMVYRQRRLEHFRPPDRMLVPDHAERYIVLPETETDFPGSYRTMVAPYCLGPMRAFTNPAYRYIVFVTPTQAGKSVNLVIVPICYIIDQEPGNILMIQPTHDDGSAFSKERLQPIINNSPRIRDLRLDQRHDFTKMSMTFKRCMLNIVGSNSAGKLASRPVPYLFCDEIDKYPPAQKAEADALSLALERCKRRGRKIVLTSTPSEIDGNIWKWWDRSDQRHLMISCPHCGHKQKPIMGAREEYVYFEGVVLPPRDGHHESLFRLKWPKDCRISELTDRAWLECENYECRGKIYDAQMQKATQHAEWKETGEPGNIAGFHLNTFGLPWMKLGEVAAQFLRSKRFVDELRGFYNSWLAIPWDIILQADDVIDLTKITEHKSSGYFLNQCPPEVVFLTIGIDVGAHEIYYVVRGWGANDFSALVSFGKVEVEIVDIEAVYNEIRELVKQRYTKPLVLGGIDSGWGGKTAEVYLIARAVKGLICTKGRRFNITGDSGGVDIPIKGGQVIDKMPDGTRLKHGPRLYTPSTVYWKRWFFSRVKASPPCWVWPDGLETSKDGKTYLRHIDSEREVQTTNKTTGKIVKKFVVRRGYDHNHYLDCEIIACVVQEIIMNAAKTQRLEMGDIAERLGNMITARDATGEQKQRTPSAPKPRSNQQHKL